MSEFITPPFLENGDTIRIISTARKIRKKDISTCIQYLEFEGFKIEEGAHLYKEDNQFAGTDEERLLDLQEALDDDNVKAILCAKGGYGTSRIIDQVDFSKFKETPKWICGFSDITFLHGMVNQMGIESLHSTMPVMYGKLGQDPSFKSMAKALKGDLHEVSFLSHHYNKEGTVKGTLLGGNLSIINNAIGTSSAIEGENIILLIEDLDEYLYHIDRMMVHLERSGLLKKLVGMIIGQLTDMNDNKVKFGETATQIVKRNMEKYDIPLAFKAPIGHGTPNIAVYLGGEIELEVNRQKSFIRFIR